MIFLDKSAVFEKTGDRKYGWAPKRELAIVHSLFKRPSILPAYTMDGYITFTIHHGLITIEIFNCIIAEQVLSQYTLYTDGGS